MKNEVGTQAVSFLAFALQEALGVPAAQGEPRPRPRAARPPSGVTLAEGEPGKELPEGSAAAPVSRGSCRDGGWTVGVCHIRLALLGSGQDPNPGVQASGEGGPGVAVVSGAADWAGER